MIGEESAMSDEEIHEMRMAHAIENTVVVRPPKQHLATFGSTTIRYYLVTEPAYREIDDRSPDDVVIREGVVTAEQPKVVTPYYMLNHEGFGQHAADFLRNIARERGNDAPGLLYAYKNEGMQTNIASGDVQQVTNRLKRWLDREERNLEAVIRGVDELWDVSLMKFIFDLTSASVRANVAEMHARGLFDTEGGVPRDARERIEHLLAEAKRGNVDPSDVHAEIERWGLFDEYQDRFLSLFKAH